MLSDLIHEVEEHILVHCSLETRRLYFLASQMVSYYGWAWFSTLQFSEEFRLLKL
jgi:hypothetical protein